MKKFNSFNEFENHVEKLITNPPAIPLDAGEGDALFANNKELFSPGDLLNNLMFLAISRGLFTMALLLMKYGADAYSTNNKANTTLLIDIFLFQQIKVPQKFIDSFVESATIEYINFRMADGKNAFHLLCQAAENNFLAKKLISKECDLDTVSNGKTPLYNTLVFHNHEITAILLEKLSSEQLERIVDTEKITYLMIAVLCKNLISIKTLLKKVNNVNWVNHEGIVGEYQLNALDIALILNDQKIIVSLLNHGAKISNSFRDIYSANKTFYLSGRGKPTHTVGYLCNIIDLIDKNKPNYTEQEVKSALAPVSGEVEFSFIINQKSENVKEFFRNNKNLSISEPVLNLAVVAMIHENNEDSINKAKIITNQINFNMVNFLNSATSAHCVIFFEFLFKNNIIEFNILKNTNLKHLKEIIQWICSSENTAIKESFNTYFKSANRNSKNFFKNHGYVAPAIQEPLKKNQPAPEPKAEPKITIVADLETVKNTYYTDFHPKDLQDGDYDGLLHFFKTSLDFHALDQASKISILRLALEWSIEPKHEEFVNYIRQRILVLKKDVLTLEKFDLTQAFILAHKKGSNGIVKTFLKFNEIGVVNIDFNVVIDMACQNNDFDMVLFILQNITSHILDYRSFIAFQLAKNLIVQKKDYRLADALIDNFAANRQSLIKICESQENVNLEAESVDDVKAIVECPNPALSKAALRDWAKLKAS